MESLVELVLLNPKLAGVLSALYIISLINKPLFTFLAEVVKATPSTKDNEILDKVVNSQAYKAISYLLDWVTRVKLPK